MRQQIIDNFNKNNLTKRPLFRLKFAQIQKSDNICPSKPTGMVLSELQDGRSLTNGQPCPQPEDDEPAESKDGNSSRGAGQESKTEETEYELNLALSVLQS